MPRRCPVLVFVHELPKSDAAATSWTADGLQQIMRLFGHEAHHFSAGCSLKLNDAVITAPYSRPPRMRRDGQKITHQFALIICNSLRVKSFDYS
ncbi:hypothetical protein CEXT_469131 [Caerostris extrusa]|uniref:Uncharacterized protein n=1 Tax=Caerostris extrusa TaxID=172846 RepID=A0AAV4R8S7_CAEEX|nr:hypothetical protein CEXT_469131 [Caerostris extrusa]